VVPAGRPDVLFVGINPSLRSASLGHHFAGPGNPFWRLLFAAKLIPEPIGAADDQRLAEWGYALTNLCPRPSRSAAELSRLELRAGALHLRKKIARLRPRHVVLVGVGLYRLVFPRAGAVASGPGAKPETLSGAAVFVLPNPSGLNASFPGFEDKRVWFAALRRTLSRRSRSRSQPGVRPPRPV
jgi:TDG/mug DNA glycosylase family protein